ncbi:MAG: transporter [Sphingomonadales bacterium]
MRLLPFVVLLAVAAPANAELKEFCASRPGLGTPACTIDAGHVMVEVGLTDWTLDNAPDDRTDSLIFGDFTVRVGLDDMTEAQVGWTPYGHVRIRDKATGVVMRTGGIGDVTLALRRSVSGPSGLIAVQPYVTLPTGGDAIGAGDWAAGLIVPIGFDLGHDVQLSLTPQIEATVDQSRSGRHLSYGSVIGMSAPLTRGLTGAVEFQAIRDDDPSGKTTQTFASTSLAWMVGENTQFDLGCVAGLTSDSPDVEVYFGIARRF